MWGDVWGGGGSRCRSYIHATARTRHAARAAVRAGGVAPCRGGRPQRAGGRPPACRARAVRVGRCDQDSHRGSAGATLSVFFFFFSVGRCWWTTWRRLLHCTPHAATAGVREAVRGGDAMHMRDLDRDVLVFHTQVNQSVWPATAPLPRWTRPRTRDRHATHNKRQTLSTHTAHTTRYPLRARRYSYTPRATRYTPPR